VNRAYFHARSCLYVNWLAVQALADLIRSRIRKEHHA
jgi:hypothetical protein